jgi:Chaperone of endosialidase
VNDMADGLGFAPRVREPESALAPGMAVPAPRAAVGGRDAPAALNMPDTSGPGLQAILEPPSWNYDFDPGTGSARATFNGIVQFTSGGSASSGVSTFNGRSGAVSLTLADITGAGGAPLNSPTFINANANTPAPGDSTTKVATTMFVSQAIAATPMVASFNGRTGAIVLTTSDVTTAGGAPIASPAFTGNPTAPTPAPADLSGSIATTQFVGNSIAGFTVTSFNGRKGAVSLTLSDVLTAGAAPLASPAFTGSPTGPTPTIGDASTKLATTAFVTNAVTAATTGVASFNGRQGVVTLQAADISGVGGALLAGPAFTGVPTAPTPSAADNSTKIATTAFVANAISTAPASVTSFNGRQGVVALQAADVTGIGGALLASPNFTGVPIAPTPAPGDNSTKLATTAFVAALGGTFAPLAGAAFTGAVTVQAPTVGANPATKTYVDGATSGLAATSYVDTADAARVLKAGDTMTGPLIITTGAGVVPCRFDGPSGNYRGVGGYTGGSIRWSIALGDSAAEGGSNAGSNFVIQRYNDAGTILGSAISITRSSGSVNVGGYLSVTPAQFMAGPGSLGNVSNVNSLNFSSSGLVAEASAQAIWANKIGANGSCIMIGQGGTACGSIGVANSTTTSFNTTSDGRLKEDLRIFDAGRILDRLIPYHFAWKATGERAYGVIAQDANEVFPDAVTHDERRDAWEVDYSKFVPLLLAEIKALRNRVAGLEAALHSGGMG